MRRSITRVLKYPLGAFLLPIGILYYLVLTVWDCVMALNRNQRVELINSLNKLRRG